VEWLVMGRGIQRDQSPGGDSGGGLGVGEQQGGQVELPPVNYKLMDDVVRSIRRETPVLLGNESQPEKQSAVLATVYNISRRTRVVDAEEVSRIVGLTA
jgi:hypothetical protein